MSVITIVEEMLVEIIDESLILGQAYSLINIRDHINEEIKGLRGNESLDELFIKLITGNMSIKQECNHIGINENYDNYDIINKKIMMDDSDNIIYEYVRQGKITKYYINTNLNITHQEEILKLTVENQDENDVTKENKLIITSIMKLNVYEAIINVRIRHHTHTRQDNYMNHNLNRATVIENLNYNSVEVATNKIVDDVQFIIANIIKQYKKSKYYFVINFSDQWPSIYKSTETVKITTLRLLESTAEIANKLNKDIELAIVDTQMFANMKYITTNKFGIELPYIINKTKNKNERNDKQNKINKKKRSKHGGKLMDQHEDVIENDNDNQVSQQMDKIIVEEEIGLNAEIIMGVIVAIILAVMFYNYNAGAKINSLIFPTLLTILTAGLIIVWDIIKAIITIKT